jgi:hypothetical protein
MTPITEPRLEPSSSSADVPMSYLDQIVGAALFDLNGLPKEYFTTTENSNMSWVQTIFQALGLRSLLVSSLQLEGFDHATIYGSEFCAVVVKQSAHYIALLIRCRADQIDEALIQWAQDLQISELAQNPRFRAA